MKISTSRRSSRLSSVQASNAAAASAVTTEYHRRLKRTSSTGLARKAQKPGEIMTAVIAAIVPSGTWRALSSCGIEMTTMPPYMPNPALVSPINQIGERGRELMAWRCAA